MSTHVRCACLKGQDCPKLWRKDGSWNSRHGTAGWARRLPTSEGTKLVRQFGYSSTAGAKAAEKDVGKLLDLGTDDITRSRIGDMIAAAVKRRAPLPALEDVRRRLGLSLDPATPGVTFGQAWAAWLAGKQAAAPVEPAPARAIGEHWLLPVLATCRWSG